MKTEGPGVVNILTDERLNRNARPVGHRGNNTENKPATTKEKLQLKFTLLRHQSQTTDKTKKPVFIEILASFNLNSTPCSNSMATSWDVAKCHLHIVLAQPLAAFLSAAAAAQEIQDAKHYRSYFN